MNRTRIAAVSAAACCALAASRDARAAGLYVSDRGVRPLGRGGAFVAGADDLGAIWYNPAGIVEAPSSVLADGSWIAYSDTYTRQSLVTSAPPNQTTYVQSFDPVHGTTPFLPIPTIAGSYRFGDDHQYAVAAGVYAPYAALLDYPERIASGPSPQRYSLVSLSGSILAVVGAWFAYKPIKEIDLGVGVQALTGWLQTTAVFSACPPDNLFCAGEDPAYDAAARVKTGLIMAPSANAGVTFIPARMVRIGLSGQAPFVIDTSATVDVRLPSAPEFDSATQVGNQAHLHMELPPVVRVGVEIRPDDGDDDVRVEVAYVREFWSVQKSIDITPDNLHLDNIAGLPSPFGVAPISIPRGMQDSNSFRLGGEYKTDIMAVKFMVRAGVAYETSAIQEAYVSPFTVDSSKVTASIGGSLLIDKHLRLDGVLSHSFTSSVTVTPEEAAVPRINPVQGNPTQTAAVNGGTYTQSPWILGGGLEYRF
jgi:long-chain fatty acid transport protein